MHLHNFPFSVTALPFEFHSSGNLSSWRLWVIQYREIWSSYDGHSEFGISALFVLNWN